MFLPQFIIAMVFLCLGVAMWKLPPKKINPLYGYRSKSSMRNQQTWDFAQRVSSRKFILLGLIMLFVAAIEWLIALPQVWCALIVTASPLIAFPYLILSVENQMKRKFPNEG